MAYEPISVDVARGLADEYRKDMLLVVSWDAESNLTNVVTWGRKPQQKALAAKAGRRIEELLGLGDPVEVHQDYRREGEAAQSVDELRRRLAAIRDALAKIVISEGEDAGVILLSSDSTTHYAEQAKGQVYDHENFSPLGDALVNLARLAEEIPN